jgi:starvation-inducible DNA-binding protein
MRKIVHNLPEKTRGKVVGVLAPLLATHTDLYLQLKQAHWNIRGANFIALHELLDTVAGSVNGFVDELAERMVQLGGDAPAGTKGSVLKAAAVTNTQEGHLKAAHAALVAAAKAVYAAIDATDEAGDPVTSDMCTEIAANLDKHAWFIASHLG